MTRSVDGKRQMMNKSSFRKQGKRRPSQRKRLAEILEDRHLLAADLASSTCAAGTCTETESFSGTPDLADAAIFDQFDPALGTLISVKVGLELTSNGGSFQADNDSDQPAEFDVSFGAEGTLSSTDVGLFSAVVPIPTPAVGMVSTSQSDSFSLTGNDGDDTTQFDSGGTDWDSFVGTEMTVMSMGTIDASLHAGYEGTGSFAIDYDIEQVGSTTSAGGVFRQIDPVTASGKITVTYEYEPPPANPAIEVDKYLWDVNGSPDWTGSVNVGDELLYAFEVTNTGDVKLDDVELTDSLAGVDIDPQVFVDAAVFDQPIFIPADGNLGPFASVEMDRTSDPMEAKAWDNFSLHGETFLDSISWDGAYVEPFSSGLTPETDFLVEIYSEEADKPGTLLYSWNLDGGDAGVSDGDVTSTLLGHTAEMGGPVFHYEADLPKTVVAEGDYWISITAIQSFPNPFPKIDPTWQWHLGSGAGDGFYTYDDVFDDVVDGTPSPTVFEPVKDLSFTLHGSQGMDFDGCLEPGETVVFMGTYIVQPEDAAAGEVLNKATVTGEDPSGTEVMDMDTESTPVTAPDSSIEIDKYLWDINGSPNLHADIQSGDELLFAFDVTNTGDTKLTNVKITDSLPGFVLDDEVVTPFTAYEQVAFVPAAGSNLGPFSSVDRTLVSDPEEAKAWDNFTLSTDTTIDGISWAGAYIEPFASGAEAAIPESDFLIELYSDNAGPDAVVQSFTVNGGQAGVDDAQVTTTLLSHTAENGGPAYHYQAMFPFTTLAAGDYWISITALQTFPNPSPTIDPTWQWHLGTNPGGADGFLFYDDAFDDAGDGTPSPVNKVEGKDLAFKLHGAELTDFDDCLHPGQTVMFMGTYIVTDADVLAGEVVNKGTVTAEDPLGREVMDMDTETTPIDTPSDPSIDIDKYLWDINGSPDLHANIRPGDELIYSFDITNTGNTKLTHVEVTDALPGVVIDDQVAVPYVAYSQGIYVPGSGSVGPFASKDTSLANDTMEAKAWDNFTLDSETVIDGLSWDGAYIEPFATGITPNTDFFVEIYGNDDSGAQDRPGELIEYMTLNAGQAGVSDENVTSTLLAHTAEDGGPVYHYEAMLPFTLLPAGDYWISISALQTFPNPAPKIDPTWQWHLGTNSAGSDGFYTFDEVFDDDGDGRPMPSKFVDGKDLSFTLHAAELVDFDGCLHPGETVMFMGTYIVTEEDVLAGEIVNKGIVTAKGPTGDEVMDMDTLTTPIDTPNSSIDIDKYLWDINGSPELHSNIKVGDELIYSFDITNTGETKLDNVNVTDSLPGAVFDEQVVVPFTAYEQSILIPADSNLGPFSSVDRTLASDPEEAKAWDNFSFSAETVIDGISWDGAYIEPFAAGDTPETDFLVEIYGDSSSTPGSLLHSFNLSGGEAGVDDALVTTTTLAHSAKDGGPAYHYKAMLPFTLLAAGDYWVSITALQTFPNAAPTIDPTWQWHLGSNPGGADGFYSYDDAFDDVGDGTPSPLHKQDGKDLSFKLHGAKLIDFDGCLHPGETVMFMATYYVTEDDVAAGKVVNKGTVTADDPFGTEVMDMDTVTTPIDPPPPGEGSVDIHKYLWDINGSPDLHNDIKVGDELIYGLDVTNTGDVQLTNVVVTDQVWLVTVDEQVAIPYLSVEQPAVIPASGELGPYSSIDRELSSDPGESKAWDNFTISNGWTVIDALTWTGAYDEPFAAGLTPQTDFLVEISEADGSGKPGSVLHSFTSRGGDAGVDDVNVRTKKLDHTTPKGGAVYEYHAMLPLTGLEDGDYFISVTALQTFPNAAPTIDPTWQWHLGSGDGDGFYFYDDVFDDDGDGTPFGATKQAGKDLAFTLHAAELTSDFDGVLDPGEKVMYMARYIVRQQDIDKGVFQNDGKVVATLPDGTEIQDLDWYHVDINRTPGVSLAALPSAAAETSSGNMLPMQYKVTNDGNVSLTNVVVNDEGEGDAKFVGTDVGDDGVLSPGEVWLFEGMGQNGMQTKVTAETTLGELVADELLHEFCLHAGNADLDGDGTVGFTDFLILSDNYGKTDADHAAGDIDCDGVVGFSDFLILSDNYGQAVAAEPVGVDAAFADDGDDENWLI